MTTEADVLVALQERYCAPQYAFLPQVPDATGFQKRRTADAVAMGLWPSRGLELIGFEIKCSRGDWIRELRDPEKSDEIMAYFDRWYLVISDRKIVQNGELPPTWGLMLQRGKQTIIEIEAPKLTPTTMDRIFFAAIMRRAASVNPNTVAIEAAIKRTLAECSKREKERQKHDDDYRNGELERIRKSIEEFEAASGVKIDEWHGEKIGEAVRVVLDGKGGKIRREIEWMRKNATEILRLCDQALNNQERSNSQ